MYNVVEKCIITKMIIITIIIATNNNINDR